jgi:hypothetical protein
MKQEDVSRDHYLVHEVRACRDIKGQYDTHKRLHHFTATYIARKKGRDNRPSVEGY